ncbi:MAG: carboxypeptidase-like regulatory domain-containing protein [Bryobacteraceae bacterium]
MNATFRTIAASLAFTAAILAQDYRARLQGTVTDSTEAVVAGASVRLTNSDTGVSVARTSAENGRFLFDFVEPGNYEVSVELEGFNKYVQQNIRVQVRADVTINPILKLGALVETVTVQAAPVEVQFNTSTMALTVDRKMLTDLPVLARNPFTLALLDPAVVNRYTSNLATRNPFYMWSSSSLDVGGNTTRRNDLQLDGAPLQLGWKGSYAPPMDATQEVTVQQNAVDAEYGHSAGGVLSLSMKSGTNEFHGTGYYFGRNPALNAVTNSVVRAPNAVRNHIWGGTIGNPIIKNKLFTFTSYEQWKTKDPRQQQFTLPTDLERSGNFSQSLNAQGGLRSIFDPWSTNLNAAGQASRTPFPGNVIPANRIDPTSRIVMNDIWSPNGPGTGLTGVNNYQVAYFWFLDNWNFSNRTDFNPNDKWKLFGRYSRFRTDLDQNNYSPNNSPAARNDNGGVMNSRNIAADAVYTMNPTTVLNFRWSYASLNDDYDAPSAKVGAAGLSKIWPNNPWYGSYLEGIPAIYYPEVIVSGRGTASFGKGGWWFQHPSSYNYSGRISKNVGRHYMKWGGESRLTRGNSVRPNLMNFRFGPAFTADTFQAPNTLLRGDGWATFLLGAIDETSQAQFIPLQKAWTDFYGLYFHNDIKIGRNLTLNLGIRYEYETGVYDADDRLSRQLDLNNPIPEFQQNPPRIPADVLGLRTGPPIYNGAWQFVSADRRSSWDSQKNVIMPRAGFALRINDRTAFRAGFARYVVPPILTTDTLGSARYPGFSAITTVAPDLQGVPQARFGDPYPAGNPLIAPVDRTLGRYTNLGNTADWNKQDFRSGVNDRINFSLQKQLPSDVHLDVTYFVNFGRALPYNLAVNMTDPNLVYQYKAAVDRSVANPFFQYLTPETFPGQLRNQRNIRVRDLLRPYPQYGNLTQFNTDGVRNRYQALQVKIQRAYANGAMFLIGYNYNREKTDNFFNDIDQFAGRFTYLDSNNPRHRISTAGVYDLPVGRGRRFMSTPHPVVDAILGGWSVSGLLFANTGGFLRFGAMQAAGNPKIDNPTRDRGFDTSQFSRLPAYTPRANPYQYPDLTGWFSWNLDTTLSKFFRITERVRFEMRLEGYNITNSFIPTDPNTNVLQPTFGRSLSQLNRGREFQYTARIHF